jgi:hypothetical protein
MFAGSMPCDRPNIDGKRPPTVPFSTCAGIASTLVAPHPDPSPNLSPTHQEHRFNVSRPSLKITRLDDLKDAHHAAPLLARPIRISDDAQIELHQSRLSPRQTVRGHHELPVN